MTRLWGGGATSSAGISVIVGASPLSLSPSSDAAAVVTGGNGRFLARLGDSKPLVRNNYVLTVSTNAPTGKNAPFAIR